MAVRKLVNLPVDSMALEKLDKAKITTVKVMILADVNHKEATDIIKIASSCIVGKKCQSALDIWKKKLSNPRKNYFPFGKLELDKLLGGGIHIPSLVEVCGPPGVGKSQLCLTSCVELLSYSISNNEPTSVIYIDTELKFDPRRYMELAHARYPQLFPIEFQINSESLNVTASDLLLSRTHIQRPESTQELTSLIEGLQSFVLSQNVGMVIIDSVAALLRKEGLSERDTTHVICKQTQLLKTVATVCHCVILATNQVQQAGNPLESTPSPDNPYDLEQALNHVSTFWDESSKSWYRPSLGLSWFHSVDTRLVLTTTMADKMSEDEPPLNLSVLASGRLGSIQREIVVTKSALAGLSRIPFQLQNSGVS